jgi:hypothetical protein
MNRVLNHDVPTTRIAKRTGTAAVMKAIMLIFNPMHASLAVGDQVSSWISRLVTPYHLSRLA